MEKQIKHLEFIQNTINRMAHNSFLLKGWNITLVSALIAFAFKELNPQYLYISGAITVFFLLLDSYFLSRERLFIRLYNHVRKIPDKDIDFSMDIKEFECPCNWADAIFSKTLLIFYGGILLIHLFAIYII